MCIYIRDIILRIRCETDCGAPGRLGFFEPADMPYVLLAPIMVLASWN
jgi:hypothetical protein